MTMKALLLCASVAALGLSQAGVAAAETRLPSTVNPKTCSYNACIRECIRTRVPNCDQACQRCPSR
jgi:hypothetical protein